MPLVFSATGTIAPPIPWPVNEGETLVTTPTAPQTDIKRAIQTSLDLSAEVNSVIQIICTAASKDPRTVLFALRDVVNRMVAGCDDLTDVRNFTP